MKATLSLEKEMDIMSIIRSLRYLRTAVNHLIPDEGQRKHLEKACFFEVISVSDPEDIKVTSRSTSKNGAAASSRLSDYKSSRFDDSSRFERTVEDSKQRLQLSTHARLKPMTSNSSRATELQPHQTKGGPTEKAEAGKRRASPMKGKSERGVAKTRGKVADAVLTSQDTDSIFFFFGRRPLHSVVGKPATSNFTRTVACHHGNAKGLKNASNGR